MTSSVSSQCTSISLPYFSAGPQCGGRILTKLSRPLEVRDAAEQSRHLQRILVIVAALYGEHPLLRDARRLDRDVVPSCSRISSIA